MLYRRLAVMTTGLIVGSKAINNSAEILTLLVAQEYNHSVLLLHCYLRGGKQESVCRLEHNGLFSLEHTPCSHLFEYHLPGMHFWRIT